jgi:hypothetical protein
VDTKTPPAEAGQPEPQPEERFCPRCGAAYEPLQEYCLECGQRLPVNRGLVGVLASAWQRHLPWYPGDFIWPVLLCFCVAAIATTVVLLAQSGRNREGAPALVATSNDVTVGPGVNTGTVGSATLGTGTLPTAPEPTTVTGTLPTPPGTGTTPPTTTAPPPAKQLIRWPAGESGYTVVLESLPKSGGRTAAIARARQALTRDLPEVGVLDSNNYSSLHPGYYVVFSGVFGSFAEASTRVSAARAAGFAKPYVRQITT